MTKGLICEIYRGSLDSSGPRDYSNGGVSSRCRQVTLVGPDVDAAHGNVFEPKPDRPAVKLVRRQIGGREYIHAEPIDRPEGRLVGPMDGGTFIYTSDARFSRAVGSSYPVALHDRWETPEQYDRLSR